MPEWIHSSLHRMFERALGLGGLPVSHGWDCDQQGRSGSIRRDNECCVRVRRGHWQLGERPRGEVERALLEMELGVV